MPKGKQLYLLLFLIFVAYRVAASSHSAIVLDAKTREPLPFSTITIENTYYGTVANAEGYFTLDFTGYDINQLVVITFLGYEPTRISIRDLLKSDEVLLNPSAIKLNEVPVYANKLNAREILERAKDQFEANHGPVSQKREVFLHRYEKAFFPKENELNVKTSDFVGIDKQTIAAFMKKLPEDFVEYQDAILDWYVADDESVVIPVEAISMEEGSTNALMREFEQNLTALFEDIDRTNAEEDQYFKFRTGIFAVKADKSEHSVAEVMKDTVNYQLPTRYVQGVLKFMLSKFAGISSSHWEFINKPGRYQYSLEGLTTNNGQWVYHITFVPNKNGRMKGEIFVDSEDFGIHQVAYEYLEGKHSERFQLLGFGHSLDYVKGRVIYQKKEDHYFVKYIKGEHKERASIDRNFSVIKKEKRMLWDKTLNEVKLQAQMDFNINSEWEMLVMENQPIKSSDLDDLKEPDFVKFKKKLIYDPAMWEKGTVIVPSTELQKYKRN